MGAIGTEFKMYLPQIIPQILRVFMHDNSQGRVVTSKVESLSLRLIWVNLKLATFEVNEGIGKNCPEKFRILNV